MGNDEKIICNERKNLDEEFKKLKKIIDVNLLAVIKVTMLSVLFMMKLKTPG